MTHKDTSGMTLTRLSEVFDLHGADERRWPEAEREALRVFCTSEPRARDLLAEARAFDNLLDLAPSGNPSGALKDRIVAAAVASGGREARVIPIGAGRARPRPAAPTRAVQLWPAAGMLAASLAVGLYLGVNGLLGSAFDGAVQTVLSATGYDETVVALDLGGGSNSWEDLL